MRSFRGRNRSQDCAGEPYEIPGDGCRLGLCPFGPALPLTEGLIVPLLSIDRTLPHIDADDAAAFEELLAPTRPIGTTDSTVSFTCRDVHLQQAHMLFGGCQAMMHERAAMLTSRRAPVQGTASHLASIRVNYLASSKQGDELEACLCRRWADLNGAERATTSRLTLDPRAAVARKPRYGARHRWRLC